GRERLVHAEVLVGGVDLLLDLEGVVGGRGGLLLGGVGHQLLLRRPGGQAVRGALLGHELGRQRGHLRGVGVVRPLQLGLQGLHLLAGLLCAGVGAVGGLLGVVGLAVGGLRVAAGGV